MLETFLLASDADEMKKKKEKPSVKNVEMRKSAVAIWEKDKATGQFSVMKKSFKAIIHCNLKRQLSD